MTNTRRIKFVAFPLLAMLALMFFGLFSGLSTQAATEETTGDIGYYVRAVLPENQIDDTLTYFDLRMTPGQTQQVEVEVVNETDEAITVDVDAISASTNRNGVIDYKTPDIRDKTLANPFSELAALENGSLTVGPQGTEAAKVNITMPEQEYDGVVLGGLVFTRQNAAATNSEGTTIQNVYSYVVGVKLTETDTTVLPGFEIESVQADTVNYLPAMVHSIRNKEAAIAKGIDLDVTVRDAEGNVVAQASKTGVDMAPNSVMPLAVSPVSGENAASGSGENDPAGAASHTDSNGQLVPGDYTSEITLTYEGQSQSFTEKFTIGSVEAENINTALPGSDTEKDAGFSLSAPTLILLVVAVAIIVVLLIVILLLVRRRRDQEDRERKIRRKNNSNIYVSKK